MHRILRALRSSTGFAAAALAVAPLAPAQGDTGFLRGTGRTDVAFSYDFESFDHFWAGSTKMTDPNVGKVTHESANVWLAYGIDAHTDLVLSASYVDAESDGIATTSNRDEKELQDAVVGFKRQLNTWQLGPGRFSLYFAPAAKIPMSHYENNAITGIGDGQIDYRGRGILQYTTDWGIWLAAESGYDYRTESPPNEIPLNLTLGIPCTRYLTIMPFYSMVSSLGHRDLTTSPFPVVQEPGVAEEYKRWGVSVVVQVSQQIGFTAGWKDTLDGRNTGDVSGYWVGAFYKF
jgi:hypothetical protein